MSLSDDLRDELAQITPLRRCCCHAELSALFHASGAWHLRGGSVAVHLDLASPAVARRSFALLRDLGVRSEIRTYRRQAFDRATRYQLHVEVDQRGLDVLREAGVLSPSGAPLEHPPKRVVGRSCCRGAYVRGALLGGGSLSGPRDPHLEIRASGVEGARFIAELAVREGAKMGVSERRNHAVAYAKGHEAIANLLALAGRGRHRLCGSRRPRSSPRPDRGRTGWRTQTSANLVRTARAAHAQLEAIRSLELGSLPTATRRDRRAAPSPPVRLAARVGREGATADHEARRPTDACGRPGPPRRREPDLQVL